MIAPSVQAVPVAPADVFGGATSGGTAGAVGGGWFGYLSYPDPGADGAGPRLPRAAGGWSDCVLRQDRDGRWWYESLTDAALPDWLTGRLQAPPAAGWHVDWVPPDPGSHRRGVQECLAAIAAGEIYQGCVCTRYTGRLDGAPVEFFADAGGAHRPGAGGLPRR